MKEGFYLIEVELKCELYPELLYKLDQKLLDMRFHGIVSNTDIYYDTPGWNLLQQAVFVRVRNSRLLEFKFNNHAEQAHSQSIERVFPLRPEPEIATKMNSLFLDFLPHWSAAADFAEAITINDLIMLAQIHNTREIYSKDDMHLTIDHVEDLGDFLEVEVHCEEGTDTSKALARLHCFLAGLGVQPIAVGYVELWLRIHNPQAYQVGKYRLSCNNKTPVGTSLSSILSKRMGLPTLPSLNVASDTLQDIEVWIKLLCDAIEQTERTSHQNEFSGNMAENPGQLWSDIYSGTSSFSAEQYTNELQQGCDVHLLIEL